MSADRVSYTLDSTLETVNNAEETAGRIAAEAGFDDEEIMKISMAVREGAVKPSLHGKASDPPKKVKLAVLRSRHQLVRWMASPLSISAAESPSAKAAWFCAKRCAICFPKDKKRSC